MLTSTTFYLPSPSASFCSTACAWITKLRTFPGLGAPRIATKSLSSVNLHAKATLPVRPLLITLNKILKELAHKVKPISYCNHARRF